MKNAKTKAVAAPKAASAKFVKLVGLEFITVSFLAQPGGPWREP
jgi:hypothetical protein